MQVQQQLGKKDLSALAELIRELGLPCEETHMMPEGDVLQVKVGGTEVYIKIGYNRFMATDKIRGLPMSFFGHGGWEYVVAI